MWMMHWLMVHWLMVVNWFMVVIIVLSVTMFRLGCVGWALERVLGIGSFR